MDTSTEKVTVTAEMHQVAPYPYILRDLVDVLEYRRHLGWRVWLENDYQRDKPGRHAGESRGLTLIVQRHGHDTYDPGTNVTVSHCFAVPPATYDERSWQRWLFDRLGDVDTHERMEDFVIGGRRPYAPSHGPGNDPYMVRELGTEDDRRMRFTGELSPE
jgi:hypothetical protein